MQAQESQAPWYDIYPQWHVPFWQTSFFFYTLCAFGFLLVFLCVWMCWRLRSRTVTIDPYPVAARKALDRLQQSDLCQQGRASDFYNELVMILKKYLSACYGIDCVSATDQECLALLHATVQHEELLAIVEQVLNGTVLVRFAHWGEDERQMMADDIQRVYQIIDLSQQQKIRAANPGT